MAEPTLKDVIQRLRAEGQLTRNTGTNSLKSVKETFIKTAEEQKAVIQSLVTTQEAEIQRQITKDELARAERTESGRGTPSAAPSETPSSSPSANAQGGILSGLLKGMGVGAGLGALTGSIGKGAGGIAMLGLALPAFFGGLMAGDAGLGWLSEFGSGFDFDNLKAAAVGFTDIIKELEPDALLALAGIMGISAIGGSKAAIGLGSMGLAITSFFGGLLAGDLIFRGVSALGGSLDFAGMKAIATGFSDMILSMRQETFVVLAGIMGLSAVGGRKAAEGLGLMGLAITGFFGGLLAGDALFAGASALGADLDLSSMKSVVRGFSEIIHELTPEAALALAGIMGGAGLMSTFSKGTGLKAALSYSAIMTGIGAGISGLMIGLTAGGAGVEWVQKMSGSDGGGLKSAFKIFNESIGELNNDNAIKALTAIIGAGGVIGAISPAIAGKAGLGIFAIMSGIGAGIAGLMIGISAGEAGSSWIQKLSGSDGSGLSNIFRMFNDSILAITPDAVERLKNIAEIPGGKLAGTLAGISAGMIALFGAEGLSSLGGMALDGVRGAVNWLFGTDYGSEPSIIQQLIDTLDPLKDLDMSLLDKLDRVGESIVRLSDSLIGIGSNSSNIKELAQNLRDAAPLIESAIMGESGGFLDKDVKGLASPDIDYDSAIENINKLRISLFGTDDSITPITQSSLEAATSESPQMLSFDENMEIVDRNMLEIKRMVEEFVSSQSVASPIIVTNAPTIAPVNNNIRGATNVSNQRISGVSTSNGSGLGRFAN